MGRDLASDAGIAEETVNHGDEMTNVTLDEAIRELSALSIKLRDREAQLTSDREFLVAIEIIHQAIVALKEEIHDTREWMAGSSL